MKAKFLTNIFRREQTQFKRQGIGFQISIAIIRLTDFKDHPPA